MFITMLIVVCYTVLGVMVGQLAIAMLGDRAGNIIRGASVVFWPITLVVIVITGIGAVLEELFRG